jgi:hypothetical protein
MHLFNLCSPFLNQDAISTMLVRLENEGLECVLPLPALSEEGALNVFHPKYFLHLSA